ncbi:MAG: hypothetical protein FK734_06910 [Asgard group archaeon]|nr:hypothetical protein [Asgard group archaeon]
MSKTKYITALSVWMIFLSIGLAIPVIIEGINIERNTTEFSTYDTIIDPGDYVYFNTEVRESSRLDLYIRSWLYNETLFTSTDPLKIIFSVMDSEYFEQWILDGTPEPEILNSTYYYEQAHLSVNNLKVPYEEVYYFVLFNNNIEYVEVNIDIEIVPWGHIIPISILGFLLGVTSLTFLIKLIATSHYIEEANKRAEKAAQDNVSSQAVQKRETAPRSTSSSTRFCASCGSPLTSKDTQYCSQCGASV